MTFLKGIHYNSKIIYDLCSLLKRGVSVNLRYRIVAELIDENSVVLDVCAGTGELKKFLPKNCKYFAIDASLGFLGRLKKKSSKVWFCDLHNGLPEMKEDIDIVVMVISLCHFKKTSLHRILEDFKTMAGKVIIVEEVIQEPRRANSFKQRAMNYLCATKYFQPMELFVEDEFYSVVESHGYSFRKVNERYCVAIYEKDC